MHIRDLNRFLFELSENNNRAWFVMNKPRYDILRAEFLQLVTNLIAEISKFDPAILGCEPKKALFRINRDMRFSADKSPYKTYFSASILPSGRKKPSDGGGPAYYFQINQDGDLLFAIGEYMPPSDRLKNIRNQIVADPEGFGKMIKNKTMKSVFGGLQEDGKLTRPPKGFSEDLPHIEYIKHKGFMVWTEMPTKDLNPDTLQATLVKGFKAGYPLATWLRTAAFA